MVLSLVPSRLLSFILRALQILRVLPTTDHVTVEAVSGPCAAECPTCGSSSWRVHSHYPRTLRDFPSHGRPVTIRVTARRFRCLNGACARKTFAERLDDAAVYARRTKRLGDLQRHLGLALGGEAGTRLAGRLAVPVSADTLLRMAAATTSSEDNSSPLRVVSRLQVAIAKRYRLPAWTPDEYARHKLADRLAAASEARHVVGWSPHDIRHSLEIAYDPIEDDPLPVPPGLRPWEPWPPNLASCWFLAELRRLCALREGSPSGRPIISDGEAGRVV